MKPEPLLNWLYYEPNETKRIICQLTIQLSSPAHTCRNRKSLEADHARWKEINWRALGLFVFVFFLFCTAQPPSKEKNGDG